MKYLYFILWLPLNVLLWLLSYIIPKKDFILFSSKEKNKINWNSKFMFDYYLEKYNHKNIFWISSSKELGKSTKYNEYIIQKYSIKGFLTILQSKLLFIDDEVLDISYSPVIFWKFNIVQLWHWTGFKKIWIEAVKDGKWKNENKLIQKITEIVYWFNLKKYIFIVASSEKDKSRKEKSFNSKKVFITGSPRNDVFFNNNLRKHNYTESLNLDAYEKIILYAPTFRDNKKTSHLSDDFLTKLDTYLKEKNHILIIKKHPSDHDFTIDSSYTNIKDMTKDIDDIQEFLINTDILITDYSSIVNDFVLLWKPVLFYVYDFDSYIENCRWFNYNLKEILPWPFLYNEESIIKYIDSLDWFEEPKYKKDYNDFVTTFNYFKDDGSRERLFNYINKELWKK